MIPQPPKNAADTDSWAYASWAGPRRAMVERARKLPLRERFNEMLALIELHERFAQMRAKRGTK